MEFEPLCPGRAAQTELKFAPWSQVDPEVALDYHMHTNHTDGTASIIEMACAAAGNGIAEILFSEHVRHTSTYFPGFAQEVRAVAVTGLRAFVGVEAKVLDLDGKLDVSPLTAALCDALIGSVHSRPLKSGGGVTGWSDMDSREALRCELNLAMAIVTKSRAHILGHPLGMVISKYDMNPLDELEMLAIACREHDKAFELNARYCQSPADWLQIVDGVGCKVNFGSDAHRAEDVGSSWKVFAPGQRGVL
jgi:putative hydrolase